MKKDAELQPLNEYMILARKIKQSLKHGQLKMFVKQQRSKTYRHYSRGTVNNALRGYYMDGGVRIEYQNLDVLNCLSEFIQQQKEVELQLKKEIINNF